MHLFTFGFLAGSHRTGVVARVVLVSCTTKRGLALLLALLALLPWVARAQAPTITAVSPLANSRAAAGTGPVQVSFSQPLTAGSGAALKVYSAQRGGLRTAATPAVVAAAR